MQNAKYIKIHENIKKYKNKSLCTNLQYERECGHLNEEKMQIMLLKCIFIYLSIFISNSEVKLEMIKRLKFFELEEINDKMAYQINLKKIFQEKDINSTRSRNSKK